ncbi:MAG: hypothetical protein PWP03_534 [Candidatus Woesearchaeota archaeon]|nr:hypothetical protein [Candidatus Woesearchaeota archaeon]
MSVDSGIKSILKEKMFSGLKAFGGLFKSMGRFLNAPRSINTQLATGVVSGIGFGVGKKVGKGLIAFLRSFFPYDVYDFFILFTIIQHIFIDGIMFNYYYGPTLYVIHFWSALFFVFIFSIFRDEGDGFLASLLRNSIAFGFILFVEVYLFPMLTNFIKSPYFLINRILLPIWPIFALLYTSYRRPSTTPFVRKILAIFIIFLAVMAWPYVEKVTSQLSIPSSINSGEQIQAQITLKSIKERLKEGSTSVWDSFKKGILNPLKALINGSWIEQQISAFQPDKGQYDTNQGAFEVKVSSIFTLPAMIDDEDSITIKVGTSFKGINKNQIPKQIIEDPIKYNLKIDSIQGDIEAIGWYPCNEEGTPLMNALTYQALTCNINTKNIKFDEKGIASLKASIKYDFLTTASRDFYFMDENYLYQYIIQNKNPYLEESDFIGGPQPTKSSSGPVLLGLSANGEMSEYPIGVSTKDVDHILVISITNTGSGEINRIKNISVLVPQEISLYGCGLIQSDDLSLCMKDIFGEDKDTLQGSYKCYLSEESFSKNLIKKGDSEILPCTMKIDRSILANSYKAKLPIFAEVEYEYKILSQPVQIIKKKTLIDSEGDAVFINKIESINFQTGTTPYLYKDLILKFPILYSTAYKVAKEYDFDPAILMGLTTIEGGIQEKYTFKEYEQGSEIKIPDKTVNGNIIRGVCQVSEAAFSDMKRKHNLIYSFDDLNHYEPNMVVATFYLKWLIEQFDNDLVSALYAYNYGIGNVKKSEEKIPEDVKQYARAILETANYFKQVLKAAGLYSQTSYTASISEYTKLPPSDMVLKA